MKRLQAKTKEDTNTIVSVKKNNNNDLIGCGDGFWRGDGGRAGFYFVWSVKCSKEKLLTN